MNAFKIFASGVLLLASLSSISIAKTTWTIQLNSDATKMEHSTLESGCNTVPDGSVEITISGVDAAHNGDVKLGMISGKNLATEFGVTQDNSNLTANLSLPDIMFDREIGLINSKTKAVLHTFKFCLQSQANDLGNTQSSSVKVKDLLYTECGFKLQLGSYDQTGNKAKVALSPTGNVLASNFSEFDEDDELEVWIVGDKRLLPRLKVRRSSAFRAESSFRIWGGGADVSQEALERQSDEEPECDLRIFTLRDFSPGKGEVEIVIAGDPDVIVGTYEFRVNPLYSGAFSMGAIYTAAVNPQDKLISAGADTDEKILIKGDDSNRDFLFALFYSPFIWGKRDLAKTYPLRHYVNPTIGIVLNDVSENFLVGGSIDMPQGFFFTFGLHIRRIQVLADGIPGQYGQVFSLNGDTNVSDLPTSDRVERKFFMAASVDLDAASKFFGKVFSNLAGK